MKKTCIILFVCLVAFQLVSGGVVDSLKDSTKSLGEAAQEAGENIGKTISKGTAKANELASKVKDRAPAIKDAAQSGMDKTLSFFGDGFKKIGDTFSGWMKKIF